MKKQLLLIFAVTVLALIGAYIGYSLAVAPNSQLVFTAPAIGEGGRGVMVPFRLSITPGEGRVLVNVAETSFKADVENSLRKAKLNAERFMGVSLQGYDLLLEVPAEQKLVGGESAGTAFTLAVISLFSGHALKEGAAVSATVDENGTIGAVDGIEEKIIAAKESGKTLFVVSKEQKIKNEKSLEALGITIVRAGDVAEAAKQLLS